MSLSRYMLFVYSGLALCAASNAQVVVREYSGYGPGTYEVIPPSQVRILQPSTPGVPYDFDCYNEGTGARRSSKD